MENAHKCKACGKTFKPDARNHRRQSYCRRAECQRLRRTARQRLRRLEVAAKVMPQKSPGEARGLQAASGISEADIRQENPAIIGLISMVTGLTDLESLERVYRQCWLRGLDILSADTPSAIRKPAVIKLMEQVSEQKRNTG